MGSSEDLKIVINKLDKLQGSINRIEKALKTKTPSELKDDRVQYSRLDNMAKKLDVNIEELKKIYEIENDNVKVIININAKTEPKRQVKASLLILGALYYCLGRDIIQASELNKKLQWLGIKSLEKLSVNLKKSDYFLPVGKKGSHNFSYKITFPGLVASQKVINEIISNDSEVNNA